MEADRDAAEFILLDRLFPRSIVHALAQAELCLEQIAGLEQRIGVHDEALRVLGAARAGLEYTPLSDIVLRLPELMEEVQLACSAASNVIGKRYFEGSPALSWMGESL